MNRRRRVWRIFPFPAVMIGGILLASAWGAAATPTRLPCPLVVTQISVGEDMNQERPVEGTLAYVDPMDNARLVVVTPDGQQRLLSEGFASACDPNVSFDGRRVLFAAKRDTDRRWRVWEVGLDGQGLRAISPEHLDARQPIYATTLFTLDSAEPWPATVFVAHEPLLNEIGQPFVSSLYNVKLDGTELRKLTYNPNRNCDPFQMWDGRIVYAAERYPNSPGGRASHVGLYTIHVEGADMEFYGGGQGRKIQRMPCATERGLVVFVESDRETADGSGQLGSIHERRPHHTYTPLTKSTSYTFRYPAPLSGSRVLVSRRSTDKNGNWGIFAFDTEALQFELVYDSPEYHEVQAVVAAPRQRPDGHSTAVDTKFETGIFYGMNCYDADPRFAPHLQTGMVKRVRFIEGIPMPQLTGSSSEPSQPPFVARRLVGEAPVEADGSFNVEVPADIPLLLQTLDETGMALATCGWIWVKPQEKRGCIGCHEDPERVPENEYVLALRRPSNRLVLPASERRAVSFRNEVGPLLQRHCATADCHGGDATPLHLPLRRSHLSEADLQQAYSALLAPAELTRGENVLSGKYVDPGSARTSRLIWHLSGRDTSRPWDHKATTVRKIASMPPPDEGKPLAQEDMRTVIQWIDIGASYTPYPAAQIKTNTAAR